jgi:acyl phosphate:glycerol-3-phosphate acyltransferase
MSFAVIVLVVLPSYLLGSIPFGLLAGFARGIDVRKHGSGNIGATNVLRTLGKKWGIGVFACDVLKGAAAVLLAQWASSLPATYNTASMLVNHSAIHPNTDFTPAEAGIIAGLAAILGHNFPVWLKFKGGKGIATSAGVLLALMPLATLSCLAIWGAVFFATRYVSLASIVAAAALPAIVWLLMTFAHVGERAIFWFSCVIAALAIWRHRSNIQRLLAGTENRFGKPKHE